MSFTEITVDEQPKLGEPVTVGAYDGIQRVVAKVNNNALDDYFAKRHLTPDQHINLVQSNLQVISTIMSRKYADGQYRAEKRQGTSVHIIDIVLSDLNAGPKLTDSFPDVG